MFLKENIIYKMESRSFFIILTDMGMGGVTTAAVNFCNGLYERKNKVDVLVMDDRCSGEEVRFADGINVFHLKGKDRLWNLNPVTIKREQNTIKRLFLSVLGVFKKLINRKSRWMRMIFGKKIRFGGYDVVIAYRQCAPCYHFALNCVEAEKKVAFVLGGIEFMGDISTWRKYMNSFDAVAYVSDAVKNGFVDKYPELSKNAVTVYNVFDTESIIEKSSMIPNIEFDSQKFNIVTVSRIENTMKGTGRIPYICKKLKDKYNNVFHWYVVGGGPDLEGNVELSSNLGVNEHLTFLGADDNPYKVMKRCDLCVLPTLTEAFPMIVGESLILGIPIVTSRYPAAGEIIVDSENGLIAEQSVDSIFEKISELMDDTQLYSLIKENCERFVYDNDRSFNQLMEALYK